MTPSMKQGLYHVYVLLDNCDGLASILVIVLLGVCVCVCACACMCACVHVFVCINIHVCVCARVYIHCTFKCGWVELILNSCTFLPLPLFPTSHLSLFPPLSLVSLLSVSLSSSSSCRKSASCTHVSVLHALVALSPHPVQGQTTTTSSQADKEDEPLPITSFACQWKPPRKHKESNLQITEASFPKHVYGRERKYQLLSLADFDP